MGSKKKDNIKKKKKIITIEGTKDEDIVKEEINNNSEYQDELLGRTLKNLKIESDVNPDLENFFDKVKSEKEEAENIKNEEELNTIENDIEVEKVDNNTKNTFGSKFKTFMLIIAFLISTVYYLLYLTSALNHVNYIKDIINASSLLLVFFLIIIALIGNKKLRNIFSIFSSIIIISVISLNILSSKDIINLPTLAVLEDFTNTSIADVMKWASANNIDIETNYEYSDNVDEGNIIVQDIEAGSVLKLIDEITVTVSSGPNYDKELVLSSFEGRDVEDLIEYIEDNHLNNVTITFETSDTIERNLIISQSTKGEIKRNTSISFVISLGNASELKDIELENLVNKSLFDATFYLKSNGVKYNITYEFSSKVKVNYVISQDPKKGTIVSPNDDTVNLVISKGKEIIVPDFSKSTVDEVVEWIIDNNLKVVFAEKYSTTVNKNGLVSVSVQTGQSITEGTKITVTTSKGSLIVGTFNSLTELRTWASNNGVTISEKYEFNTSISKGNIVSLSIKSGEKIDPENQSITVTVSYGGAVIVPYFIGSSKSSIQSTCNSKGLNCTFYYVGYNGNAKDTALLQNVSSGTKVVSGTYVNIGLSSGPAQTFNVTIGSELFGTSYTSTADNLRKFLNSAAPGVTFNFVAKLDNSAPAGLIHQNSPIKGGIPINFTQGNTYTIWIIE